MGVHVARDCVKVIKWGLLSRICFLFMQVATEDFISSCTAYVITLASPRFLFQVVLNNLIPDHKGSMQDVFMSAHRHPEHDTTTETLLGGYDNWDSEYYIFIAEHGYSVYEQTMAFFPLYPSLMRLLANTILFPLSFLVPLRSLLLISGALINLVSFPLARSALYLLTLEVTGNDVMSLLAAAVFCLNPASVFMSAAYTECLFVMFTFSGVLAMEKRSPWVASVLFAFATATRANGMVLCGFIAYYHSAIILQSLLDGRLPMIVTITAAFKRFTTAAIQCLIVVLPFAIFQYYGYLLYCSQSGVEDVPPAWCSWRLPLAYSYIQEHYWDVGFLRYYEVKQVPNFLLATPIVVLSLYCIWRYFMGDCREELGS